jgi:hypothetical protein
MSPGPNPSNTSNIMGALWAGVAISAASTAYGISQNKKAEKKNEQALQDSEEGYQARLEMAAEQAKIFSAQYDEAVKNRPDLSWEEFVKSKIAAIDDPQLRAVYTNAKKEDFARMQEFANQATKSNTSNLMQVADELSGGPGKFAEISRARDNLVMKTTAADRLSRAYELAAPLRTGASSVKYDAQGNPIAGQRADAQVFNIAQEVNTAVEQEQKADLRQLEQDRLSASQSQVEKAREFMPFFSATETALALDQDRFKTVNAYQALDEQRAFDMYKSFAEGAAGITPQNPAYVPAGPGNELIKSGIQIGANSAAGLYSKYNTPKTTTTTPSSSSAFAGARGSAGVA